MHSGFSISAKTSTNGAPTGLTRVTTLYRRSATRAVRRRGNDEPPAGGPGGITLRSAVARRGPVFRRRFSMRIMDFVLYAVVPRFRAHASNTKETPYDIPRQIYAQKVACNPLCFAVPPINNL